MTENKKINIIAITQFITLWLIFSYIAYEIIQAPYRNSSSTPSILAISIGIFTTLVFTYLGTLISLLIFEFNEKMLIKITKKKSNITKKSISFILSIVTCLFLAAIVGFFILSGLSFH